MVLPPKALHPVSKAQLPEKTALFEAVEVETYGGKLQVEWDQDATVTPIGQLPFFIQFLKLGGRFQPWVDICPLHLLHQQ
jgi:hypothetical protein